VFRGSRRSCAAKDHEMMGFGLCFYFTISFGHQKAHPVIRSWNIPQICYLSHQMSPSNATVIINQAIIICVYMYIPKYIYIYICVYMCVCIYIVCIYIYLSILSYSNPTCVYWTMLNTCKILLIHQPATIKRQAYRFYFLKCLGTEPRFKKDA